MCIVIPLSFSEGTANCSTIPFGKLDAETVTKLKQIALDEKNAAIAAQKEKMEAEDGSISKNTDIPGTSGKGRRDPREGRVLRSKTEQKSSFNSSRTRHPRLWHPPS